MIQLRNLSKEYDLPVLKDISLDFVEGNLYVIKGVSGCGKSTLLNILGGIETSYQGEYFLGGVLLGELSNKEITKKRNSIGYIFQESLLIGHLTIKENLLLFYKHEEHINQYAKEFEIFDYLEKYPEQLSNGQRQRVAIIRSLLNHHEVILADEPTSALDRENAYMIAKLFAKLKSEGNIIIIATHDNCFDTYADFIIDLHYGVVKSSTTICEIEPTVARDYKAKKESTWKEDILYSLKSYKMNNKISSFF